MYEKFEGKNDLWSKDVEGGYHSDGGGGGLSQVGLLTEFVASMSKTDT